MPSKPESLHVLLGPKNKILAVYQAPSAKFSKGYIQANPKKGQQIVEVSTTASFKTIKSFEEASAMVKPHVSAANLIKKG